MSYASNAAIMEELEREFLNRDSDCVGWLTTEPQLRRGRCPEDGFSSEDENGEGVHTIDGPTLPNGLRQKSSYGCKHIAEQKDANQQKHHRLKDRH